MLTFRCSSVSGSDRQHVHPIVKGMFRVLDSSIVIVFTTGLTCFYRSNEDLLCGRCDGDATSFCVSESINIVYIS